MIGVRYERKKAHGGGAYVVTAVDSQNNYVVQREDVFESPFSITAADLRAQFNKTADVVEHAAPSEPEGWQRLSAEQRINALMLAMNDGDVQPGDVIEEGTVTSTNVAAAKRLFKLRKEAKKTPEQVFENADRDGINAAADKIWNDDGPTGLRTAFELGQLETSPVVAKELDRRIAARNREADREAERRSFPPLDRGTR